MVTNIATGFKAAMNTVSRAISSPREKTQETNKHEKTFKNNTTSQGDSVNFSNTITKPLVAFSTLTTELRNNIEEADRNTLLDIANQLYPTISNIVNTKSNPFKTQDTDIAYFIAQRSNGTTILDFLDKC